MSSCSGAWLQRIMNTLSASCALAALRRVVQLHALLLPLVSVADNRVNSTLPEVLRAVGGPYKDPIAVPHDVIVIVIVVVRLPLAPGDPLSRVHTRSYSTLNITSVILHQSEVCCIS